MVSYKELGLVNTREMFAKAVKGGYAIPAFNFNNMEQLQAIIQASAELKSPVILQVSKGARNYAYQPDTCVKSVTIRPSGSAQKLSPRFCVKRISNSSLR